MTFPVGVIGLGAMGSAYAKRLLAGGFPVIATDPKDACRTELESLGGQAVLSAREVAERADVVIISVNKDTIFHEVVAGQGGIIEAARPGLVVVDTCTLGIEDKRRGAEALAPLGSTLIDCTVSGTRPVVLEGALTLYASGDIDAFRKAEPALATFTRNRTHLGEFGNAMKLKCVLNFLVLVNNAATAEAMTLARKAGLDLDQVWALVDDSFAGSGVWRSRGRMMVDRDYVRARGTYGIARKDAKIISALAADNLVPTPVFHAALEMHLAGMAAGYTQNDTASLFEVYNRLAGVEAVAPQTPLI